MSSKGNAARWHVGVIAQDVQKVFSEEGLDAFDYGILCRDEYPAEYEVVYGTRMELGLTDSLQWKNTIPESASWSGRLVK